MLVVHEVYIRSCRMSTINRRASFRGFMIVDGSRVVLRSDMGFYIGTILRPLLKSLYRIHVLLAYQQY